MKFERLVALQGGIAGEAEGPPVCYRVRMMDGLAPGSGTATVLPPDISADEADANADTCPTFVSSHGGPEAAFEKALEFLKGRHPGLLPTFSENR